MTNPVPEKIENHLVQQFLKAGQIILDESRKPNVFTLEEFRPLLPFFTAEFDRERCNTDLAYRREWQRRWDRAMQIRPINPYQPILVIESHENPKEVITIDRALTRLASDHVDGNSARASATGGAHETAEQKTDRLISASVQDLAMANNTDARRIEILKDKMMSAVVTKRFVERNLEPGKREELTQPQSSKEPVAAAGTTPAPASEAYVPSATLFDDDDD